MKTLYFVLPSMKAGGGTRVIIELANQLIKQYAIKIVFPANSREHHTFFQDPRIEEIKVGQTQTGNGLRFLNLLKVFSYLNKINPDDIVIYTDPLFAAFSFLLRHKKSVRFIQADDYRIFDDGKKFGTGLFLFLYKILCLQSYKKKHLFLFNSKFIYDEFKKISHRNNVPCRIIHPALNHDIFYPVIEKKQQTNGPVSIVMIARNQPLKGLQTFFKMWNSLEDMEKQKIHKVTLVSQDDLSEFNTGGMEIIRPSKDLDIADAYRNADIFISTSWWEGFGLPQLEAMTCGCCCVLSDCKGINEFAVNQKNCIFFKPKDAEDLHQKLFFVINNSECRNEFVTNGIRDTKSFRWENSASELENILSEYFNA